MDRYSFIMKSRGLTGKYSPHSMCYAYARDRHNAYLKDGFSQKESLAIVSIDLGHGDGRGTYVKKSIFKIENYLVRFNLSNTTKSRRSHGLQMASDFLNHHKLIKEGFQVGIVLISFYVKLS